ncbi:fimbrial protein [Pseudomonas citronellolis]|uniref:fimbrial protein n=1 Tax=Pseudomonas citronellolis TaxID=53408 RepID=UPI0023E38D30|nr:fimbrial protein [Pseudomonas citronellolis]MDF3931449.1 fimbrial protein [Pseudomonas citronellolis]
MKQLGALVALSLALLCPALARADCSWGNGGSGYAGPGILSLTLPAALSVPRDTPVGAPLWSSGWTWAATGKLNSCSAGRVSGRLASGIGQATGKPTVHATNVPGIGVAVFWCNVGMSSCVSDPLSAGVTNNLNWSEVSALNWSYSAGTYDPFTQFWAYLVKTGDVSPGVVQIGGQSQVFYNAIEVSRLTLAGQTTISAPSCQITSGTDVHVRMPRVTLADFPAGTGVMSNNAKAVGFSIALLCSGNFKVSYKIDPVSGTSVTNVLNNAVGPGFATGVGIQLFQGDTSSTTVLPLSTKLARTTVSGTNLPVSIPLAAKYYKTSTGITGGAVRASAMFTLFYE